MLMNESRNTYPNMIDKEFELPKAESALPHDLPPDFFERLPERTLQLAKKRYETRRKNRHRHLRMVALSAAAVLLILIAVVVPKSHRKQLHAEKLEDVLRDIPEDDLTNMNVVYGSDMMEEEMITENTY